MSDLTILIIYFSLALGVSFACSVFEAVLLSVTPTYVEKLRKEGRARSAQAWGRLKGAMGRPLAAILILNTVAHTVGAAGVGAEAKVVFASVPVGVISGVLTLLILIFSEIIPKTLGATYWRRLAPPCGLMIVWLTRALHPFVWLSEKITEKLGHADPAEGSVSREEVVAMLELGAEGGALGRREMLVMRSLIRMRSMIARDIMTPRPVVLAVPEEVTAEEFLRKHEVGGRFSRIPVYGKDREDVTGYVLRDEILAVRAEGRIDVKLRELRREILAVPETTRIWELFDDLLGRRDAIRLVRDEHGGFAGIVTTEDVVETILGREIVDEGDVAVDLQEIARQRWAHRARALGLGKIGEDGV